MPTLYEQNLLNLDSLIQITDDFDEPELNTLKNDDLGSDGNNSNSSSDSSNSEQTSNKKSKKKLNNLSHSLTNVFRKLFGIKKKNSWHNQDRYVISFKITYCPYKSLNVVLVINLKSIVSSFFPSINFKLVSFRSFFSNNFFFLCVSLCDSIICDLDLIEDFYIHSLILC